MLNFDAVTFAFAFSSRCVQMCRKLTPPTQPLLAMVESCDVDLGASKSGRVRFIQDAKQKVLKVETVKDIVFKIPASL